MEASTLPAPKPYGIAIKQSIQKDEDMEKPSKAKAVIATLIAVTSPLPNFLVKRSLCKLEIIVPKESVC